MKCTYFIKHVSCLSDYEIYKSGNNNTNNNNYNKSNKLGWGCGSVGRAVASDTRGLQFEPVVIGKIYIDHLLTVSYIKKKINIK